MLYSKHKLEGVAIHFYDYQVCYKMPVGSGMGGSVVEALPAILEVLGSSLSTEEKKSQ